MAGQAGLRLRLDRRARILRVADDQALRGRVLRVRGTRSVAGLADRNARIGLVRRMQAERVQRVREVLALELMAGDAHLLADRLRVGRARIRRDDRFGEARRREQALHVLMGLVAGKVRCGQLARELLARLLGRRGHGLQAAQHQRESDRARCTRRRSTKPSHAHLPNPRGHRNAMDRRPVPELRLGAQS